MSAVWRCREVWRVVEGEFSFGLFGFLPNPRGSTHSIPSTPSTIKIRIISTIRNKR
jgi:hypothetical protein